MMVRFLKARCQLTGLACMVRARHGFKPRHPRQWDLETLGGFVDNVDDLSSLIAELEPDRKGVPVLIKQYLKLGGQLLDFNVDRKFSSALDGLVVVDLSRTDPRILKRYMGPNTARGFLAHRAHRR
jgi:hypothetical protein